MVEWARRLADSQRFQNAITGVILLAAVLVGLETHPPIVARHGAVLHLLDQIVLGIFVVEVLVKVVAEGRRPWRYFRDPWNVFDFAIVAVAFLPVGAAYVTVLRLLRLLRVLRLVRAVPRLQILVGALLKSIPSMGYVSLLLFLVFYVYGVASVFLFGQNDPFRFGSLPVALVTLFQVATAEDWSTTLYTQMYGCDVAGYEGREALCVAPRAFPVVAPLFFISFILIGTMVILNLFIGVIMNGMAEASAESERREQLEIVTGERAPTADALQSDLASLERKIEELQTAFHAVAVRAKLRQAAGGGADDQTAA